jgi:hypothetical protein
MTSSGLEPATFRLIAASRPTTLPRAQFNERYELNLYIIGHAILFPGNLRMKTMPLIRSNFSRVSKNADIRVCTQQNERTALVHSEPRGEVHTHVQHHRSMRPHAQGAKNSPVYHASHSSSLFLSITYPHAGLYLV